MMRYLILASVFTILAVNTNAGEGARELDINGFKVILKESPKEVLSVRLFIKGGTANHSKSQEGIENLALHTVIEGGTESKSKIEFNTLAESIGASFEANSTYDFGSLSMTCISMYWDQSWSLFTDAILNPAFDPKEFGLIKEQLIAAANQNESNPDVHLRNVAMEQVFEGKNYAKTPEGNAESLEKLALQTVESYYDKLLDKSKCFLVVVGKIDEDDLRSRITESFAKLPQGKPAPKEPAGVVSEADHHIEDRDIATNYIRGVFSAPNRLSDEAVPMRLAMSILRDRYFVELRTKRSLSYAPSAFYATLAITNPYNVIYISTLDPKQSMEVMVNEINSIKKEGFKERELKDQQQTFLTYHYMGLETSASQSQELGMAEIAGGWEMADNFTRELQETTLQDLNRVFDKYTHAIHWVYLGKKDMVDEDDFVQTETYKDKPY